MNSIKPSTKQQLYCNVCGLSFMHDFTKTEHPKNGQVCSMECSREWNWLRTLSLMGSKYKPRPPEADQPVKVR